MKKFYAGALAVLLGIGGAVGLAVAPASAHNSTDTINCSTAEVHLTNYDGAATVKVTLDGVVVQPKIPFGGVFHYSQALTFSDATPTHTLVTEVLSNDPGYSFTHTKTTPAECFTITNPDATATLLVVGASCDAAGSASWTGVLNADVSALDQTPGDHSGVATAQQYHKFIDGEPMLTVPYTIQPKIYNASCVPPQQCVVGGPYHESDDNAAVLSTSGLRIFNSGDGKATDGGGYYLTSGNAQGITQFDYTKTGEVGNGIFFRLIFDLSADGGPGYASFSGLGTHVDQSTVAGYGSKAAFNALSIADVANTWPKNKLIAFIWQTGSAYAAGDGAVLTSFSGYCGNGNFIPTVPSDTHRTTTTTDEIVCKNWDSGIDLELADNQIGGGGTYDKTVTNYTTTPVWNESTQSYDLVETIDEGYPIITVIETDASLESCPKHATPVVPEVTAVCDADDTVKLVTTENISYTVSTTVVNQATVTATPADATVLDEAEGWTIQDDGTANYLVLFNNDACPLTVTVTSDGTLAFTGSDPTNLFLIGGSVLLLGLGLTTSAVIKRRKSA